MAAKTDKPRAALLLSRAVGVLVPLALPSTEAFAGTLTCNFTEPFFTIAYDSETGRVMYTSPDEFDEETGKSEPRVLAEGARIRRSGKWEGFPTLFLETPGKDSATPPALILEMKVTGLGTDGMSDRTFPFEGRYADWVGGCESSKAPAFDMYEALEDIGVVEDEP